MVLRVHHCEYIGRDGEQLPPWIIVLLQQAGFYGFWRVGFMKIDWHLITALVERWRPEKHTFHLLGLPVEGHAVIMDTTGINLHQWCHDLLGRDPEDKDWKGSRLKMSWIKNQFMPIPDNVDGYEVREQYTRAYILLMIGGCLFPDNSSSHLYATFLPLLQDFRTIDNYSWGSATLAWLYRQLCRASRSTATEIWGPVILLQL